MQSYFFQILLALKSIIVFGSALLNYGDFSTFGFKIIMSSPKALGQGRQNIYYSPYLKLDYIQILSCPILLVYCSIYVSKVKTLKTSYVLKMNKKPTTYVFEKSLKNSKKSYSFTQKLNLKYIENTFLLTGAKVFNFCYCNYIHKKFDAAAGKFLGGFITELSLFQ